MKVSARAGRIDDLGLINLGSFFVSFMSDNSTRLTVGLVKHLHKATLASGLIGLFVFGVIVGLMRESRAMAHRHRDLDGDWRRRWCGPISAPSLGRTLARRRVRRFARNRRMSGR